jgi:hypothetical protein
VRILSGGQSGVDRGALDAAVACGVPYGGWCPLGGGAEDVPDVRVLYPLLRETPSVDVSQRTLWNARDTDATLVICGDGVTSPGTELTISWARRLHRPLLVSTDVAEVRALLHEAPTVNVAGPRASEWREGYAVAYQLLTAAFGDVTA